MATVTFEVPDEVAQAMGHADGRVAREIRLAAAMYLSSRGELATSLAARLAFLAAAGARGVELFPVKIEELKQELCRD